MSNVFHVSGASQLTEALSRAAGGDKIVMAAGNYGSVRITGRTFSSPVVIASAPGADAHIESLKVFKSSNITFSGLDLGRGLQSSEPYWTQLNSVRDSSNITYHDVHFRGSLDNVSSNDGIGLTATDVKNLTIVGSEFEQLYRGVFVQRSAGTIIKDNEFHDLRLDGVNIAAASNIKISGNHFHDFHPLYKEHADAIQFWNTNERVGSTSITISDNVIMQGKGGGMQGIFISDPKEFGYRDITIENNLLHVRDQWNGITVNGGADVTIRNNSVLSPATDAKKFWIRLEDTSSILMSDNVMDDIEIISGVKGLTSKGNLNLAVDGASRSLFGNLENPQGAGDLIVPELGFQLDKGAGGAAPVAPPAPAHSEVAVPAQPTNENSPAYTTPTLTVSEPVYPGLPSGFLLDPNLGNIAFQHFALP